MKYLLLLMLIGCGTTSLMECDGKISFDKKECVKRIEAKQLELVTRDERLMELDKGHIE